jgi:hypothetical protein
MRLKRNWSNYSILLCFHHSQHCQLAKLNEREGEMAGRKAYEIQFSITLGYSGDKLHCRSALCSELQNYSISIDEISKIATIKGWLFFEQTEQGWR